MYLPNLEVEVEGEAGWLAVKDWKKGEKKGGNFVHLCQVGGILERDATDGQALANLLRTFIKTKKIANGKIANIPCACGNRNPHCLSFEKYPHQIA